MFSSVVSSRIAEKYAIFPFPDYLNLMILNVRHMMNYIAYDEWAYPPIPMKFRVHMTVR